VLIRQLPAESLTAQAVHGDALSWSAGEYLLAGVLDALNIANWQRTGRRGRPRPQRVQRPGTGPKHRGNTGTMTTAQVRAYLDQFKPARSNGEGVSHAR
jgi:Family of unknown function (DUF5361)